ncbi:MAG: hypothetical protein ACHQW9_01195 [Nitrososphaerales archaeon]
MTKVLLQVLIAVSVLSSVSLLTVNSFAENAKCGRDCEAPTLGALDDGQRLVENGLTINSRSINVEEHIQSIPTTALNTGDTVKVRLVVYENSGVSGLRHTSLAISDYKDDKHSSDKVDISFDQNFLGAQTVTVTDPDGFLKGATAKATELNEFSTLVEFSFTIMKPFETSALIVESWDANLSSRSNVFLNAVKAEGDPVIEKAPQRPANIVPAPLKQVKAGVEPEQVECREGFELVIRSATGAPACVYPFTAEILRSWEMVAAN